MEEGCTIENSRTFQSKIEFPISDAAGRMCARRFKVLVLRRQEELVGSPQHGIFAIMVPMDFVDALGPVSAAQERLAPPGTRWRGRHKKLVHTNRSVNNRFHIQYNFSSVILYNYTI